MSSTTATTPASLETELAGDAVKALSFLPIITSTIAAGQAALTADQHASVVTTTLDLLNVGANSATAIAKSGSVGAADATHITQAVAAVQAAEPIESMLASVAAIFKSAFSWL